MSIPGDCTTGVDTAPTSATSTGSVFRGPLLSFLRWAPARGADVFTGPDRYGTGHVLWRTMTCSFDSAAQAVLLELLEQWDATLAKTLRVNRSLRSTLATTTAHWDGTALLVDVGAHGTVALNALNHPVRSVLWKRVAEFHPLRQPLLAVDQPTLPQIAALLQQLPVQHCVAAYVDTLSQLRGRHPATFHQMLLRRLRHEAANADRRRELSREEQDLFVTVGLEGWNGSSEELYAAVALL